MSRGSPQGSNVQISNPAGIAPINSLEVRELKKFHRPIDRSSHPESTVMTRTHSFVRDQKKSPDTNSSDLFAHLCLLNN